MSAYLSLTARKTQRIAERSGQVGRVRRVGQVRQSSCHAHPVRAAGKRRCPTPLPRISTLCVLPRPPGMSSVFSASRFFRSDTSRFGRDQADQEIRLVEETERRQPLGFGSRRTLVKSTCAVMSCSPASCSQAGASDDDSGPAAVWRANVVSVPAGVGRRIQLARLVAVVDQDDEPARSRRAAVADPVDGRRLIFDPPAGLERRRPAGRDTPPAPASTAGLRSSRRATPVATHRRTPRAARLARMTT